MIQVFDPHRLMYRNATLIARALADRTRRISFLNVNDAGAPYAEFDTAYTNEQGYVCYGSGRQRVQCLAVAEDAIIQVSLDNGATYSIEWVLKAPVDEGFHDTAILRYADGTVAFNPNTPPAPSSQTLRDFVQRNEIDLNSHWEEDTIIVDNAESNEVTLTQWTHLVMIEASAPAAITFDAANLRDGQVVYLVNYRIQRDITIKGANEQTETVTLIRNQTAHIHLTTAAGTESNASIDVDAIMTEPNLVYVQTTSDQSFARTNTRGKLAVNMTTGLRRLTCGDDIIPLVPGAACLFGNGNVPVTIMDGPGFFNEIDSVTPINRGSYYWDCTTKALKPGYLNIIKIILNDPDMFAGTNATIGIVVPVSAINTSLAVEFQIEVPVNTGTNHIDINFVPKICSITELSAFRLTTFTAIDLSGRTVTVAGTARGFANWVAGTSTPAGRLLWTAATNVVGVP